jgi:glyoxylase-like metal-dependent hydrolase (beta-lactamase superfamily II)
MHIVKETDRLHRLTRLIFNCFLLTEDDGSATLIDTGLPGSASAILEQARRLGTPIRRILLTHAHTDHVGSLDAICAALRGIQICIGADEAPLLAGDCSSYGYPPGQRAFGFMKTRAQPSHLLQDGEMVGPLRTVFSPGHTPGHVAFLDVRDGTLLAGDSFTTQMGVVAAGVFKLYFPLPRWFSWKLPAAAESARKLCDLRPTRLAAGHGNTLENPGAAMERAASLALRQAAQSVQTP